MQRQLRNALCAKCAATAFGDMRFGKRLLATASAGSGSVSASAGSAYASAGSRSAGHGEIGSG